MRKNNSDFRILLVLALDDLTYCEVICLEVEGIVKFCACALYTA